MLALPWLETTGPYHVGSIKKKVQQQPRSIPHFRSTKSGTTMHHMRLIDTNPLTQLPWSSVVSHSNLSWTTLIALTQYMLWETDTQTAQITTHLTQFQPPIAFDFTSIKKKPALSSDNTTWGLSDSDASYYENACVIKARIAFVICAINEMK